MPENDDITVIKKYANRRLYNTATSVYITLEDLCDMVKRSEEFIVIDSKNGQDLTRSTLTQIIFDQESKGYNLLPVSFLKQIIRYYDDSTNVLVPQYLESSMAYFAKNRDKMEDFVKNVSGNIDAIPGIPAFNMEIYEQMAKQNMEIFEQALQFFSPFTPNKNDKES